LFVTFGTYALGVWYGAKLIMEKEYSGGRVINVIVAILIGSSYVAFYFNVFIYVF